VQKDAISKYVHRTQQTFFSVVIHIFFNVYDNQKLQTYGLFWRGLHTLLYSILHFSVFKIYVFDLQNLCFCSV